MEGSKEPGGSLGRFKTGGKEYLNLLTFFYFGQAIIVKIRTTNIIKRSFREVRRRVRPIGCFYNYYRVNRIVFGVISGLNKNWEGEAFKGKYTINLTL